MKRVDIILADCSTNIYLSFFAFNIFFLIRKINCPGKNVRELFILLCHLEKVLYLLNFVS